MGHGPSHTDANPADNTQRIKSKRKRQKKFIKLFKELVKLKGNKINKRKNDVFNSSANANCQTANQNVILPNANSLGSSPQNLSPYITGHRKSKQSLFRFILSTFSIFNVQKSKEKVQPRPAPESKFVFRKKTAQKREFEELFVSPPLQNNETSPNLSTLDVGLTLDENNNPISNDELIKRILSPSTQDENQCKSTEEIYRENLERFEKIVALTATANTSDEEDSSFYLDENNNYVRGNARPDSSNIPSRVITSSKNKIDFDPSFVKWIMRKVTRKSASAKSFNAKKEGKLDQRQYKSENNFTRNFGKFSPEDTKLLNQGDVVVNKLFHVNRKIKKAKKRKSRDENNNIVDKPDDDNDNPKKEKEDKKKVDKKKKKSENVKMSEPLSPSYDKESSTERRRGETQNSTTYAKSSPSPRSTPKTTSTARSRSKNKTRGRRASPKSARWNDYQQAKRSVVCGGKSCYPTAPPVYLDYGVSSCKAAMMRKTINKDRVMERLKNVDVVEELTYMVPNGSGDGVCEEEQDDCDYYAVCESCGEMEPIPEELKKKIKKDRAGNSKQNDETPVTYSRRQRFNFKNKEEDDDDGPPFPYVDNQSTCRCPCCLAGLRRNPNCCCKCCQTMGNCRRCNSFDEFPVGKNPQIRRILCPEEECEKAEEEYQNVVPEESGMYQFDKEEQAFERQVPRTPTPIILPVPVPRPLRKHELRSMAHEALTIRDCAPPEPLYLPPMFGPCNPGCPPCCAPKQQQQQQQQQQCPNVSCNAENKEGDPVSLGTPMADPVPHMQLYPSF